MTKKVLFYISGGLVVLTLISGVLLSSFRVQAESAGASVTVPGDACSIMTDTTNDTPHTATVNNGTFKEDIGTTTFRVFCNDSAGFSVYAIGYANNEFGNNKLLATVGGTLSPVNDIVTGTATSGNVSNWAMKLTPVAGTYVPTIESDTNGSFSAYHIVPDTYTKVATFNSVTDATSGSAFTSTYRAYIAQAQPAGTYNGKVRYTLVHPANASAPLPGITLLESYEMAGKTKVNGYYTLQDMNTTICDTATIVDEPSQMQAIDIRDNKVYWITKLQDGKCWMTQNLDHDISTTFAYTPDNTDITANWTPTRATINAATTGTTAGSITGWSDDDNTPYSVDPGNWYWKNSPFYDSNLCYVNSSSQTCNFITKANSTYSTYFADTSYATNGEHGHVGNYYNWSAAVASNDTSSYTTSTYNNPVNNPQTSICPKGWRLPTISSADYTTNGTTKEFARLANIYAGYSGSTSLSSENLEKAPLYFVRSGRVHSSQQYSAGYNGYYWSSSVFSSGYAYYLYFSSDGVNPANYGNGSRGFGFSVRCVAR